MNMRIMEECRQLGAVRNSAIHSHGLDVSSYSGDDALAALLDRYPEGLIDVNQYSYDAEGQVTLMAGERGQTSGAELLEAVRKGRMWINLRSVEDVWPEFWNAATDAFDDIASAYEDMHAVDQTHVCLSVGRSASARTGHGEYRRAPDDRGTAL